MGGAEKSITLLPWLVVPILCNSSWSLFSSKWPHSQNSIKTIRERKGESRSGAERERKWENRDENKWTGAVHSTCVLHFVPVCVHVCYSWLGCAIEWLRCLAPPLFHLNPRPAEAERGAMVHGRTLRLMDGTIMTPHRKAVRRCRSLSEPNYMCTGTRTSTHLEVFVAHKTHRHTHSHIVHTINDSSKFYLPGIQHISVVAMQLYIHQKKAFEEVYKISDSRSNVKYTRKKKEWYNKWGIEKAKTNGCSCKNKGIKKVHLKSVFGNISSYNKHARMPVSTHKPTQQHTWPWAHTHRPDINTHTHTLPAPILSYSQNHQILPHSQHSYSGVTITTQSCLCGARSDRLMYLLLAHLGVTGAGGCAEG